MDIHQLYVAVLECTAEEGLKLLIENGMAEEGDDPQRAVNNFLNDYAEEGSC